LRSAFLDERPDRGVHTFVSLLDDRLEQASRRSKSDAARLESTM